MAAAPDSPAPRAPGPGAPDPGTAGRRLRHRRAARVIVRSGATEGRPRVLLFADRDPGLPGTQWWVTPGGGMDPGETWAQTAVRELFEETGLVVGESQLQGPVASRLAVHGYSDQVLVQHEQFFLVDVDRFEVDTSRFTELEQRTLLSHGWFDADELATRVVWPAQLGDYLAWAGEPADEWGVMDESTVPVDPDLLRAETERYTSS
ncbi:NUDIX hydrolase [Aestuariimicrobium sp. Y1814]|uniref:NUDIX hydrolase n=1 Tax=Aestuariimicrobium sp. Y1814 TaxID=3418742 RepID=UPI003DA6D64F